MKKYQPNNKIQTIRIFFIMPNLPLSDKDYSFLHNIKNVLIINFKNPLDLIL